EHGDGAVQHTQAALHLHREIHVAGGVDDVDAELLAAAGPEGGGGGGGDRDAALLLLLHPVHGGGAVMDLAQLVRPAGVVEDALGRSRLPGIDVGHDADVPNAFERRGSGHLVRSRWGTPLACWGMPLACPYPFSAKTRGDRDAPKGRSRSADRKSTRLNSSHVSISYA